MHPTRPLGLDLAPSRLDRIALILLGVLLAAGLAGCGEDEPAPEPVETAPLSGTYDVTSRFEVPATVAAPGPLGDALRLLHALEEDPGTALLDLAEDAGVPAVSELRLALPDALESRLVDWMNGYLDDPAGGESPHDRVAELDRLVRSVLLRFELRSVLSLPEGDEAGTHAPVALAFDTPGDPIVVPVSATAPVTSAVGVAAVRAWPEGRGGATQVIVGDHAMGVPFGRYALTGLDALLLAELGAADLRAALADAVGCPALAAEVADRCVGPVCVGHEGTLLDVCEAGVDEAAARLEAEILALDYRAIHLARGTATEADGGALTGGRWEAAIDLGNGEEDASATFTAEVR